MKKRKILSILVMLAVMITCIVSSALISASAENTGVPLFDINGSSEGIEYAYVSEISASGYKFTLKKDEVFHYNEPINVNAGGLTEVFADIRALPRETGVSDAKVISIVITDAYDPSNYVTFKGKDYVGVGMTYWTVAPAGQSLCGLESWSGVLHRGDAYGALSSTTFHEPKKVIGCYYNNNTKGMYVWSTNLAGMELIADLDDPFYFATPWQGFTTGEVYLSFSVDDFYNSAADFVFLSAAGNTLGGKTVYEDTTAPDIKVDFGDYTESNYPKGETGLSYPVFDALAYDAISGIFTPEVKVYTVKDGVKAEVEISGGRFLTPTGGVYTIEYSATDENGNKGIKEVAVSVSDEKQPLISIVTEAGANTAYVGERVRLSKVEFDGGRGLLSHFTAVKDPDGKFISIDGLEFTPMKTGVYKVVYSALDFCNRKSEYSYDITVSVSDDAVLVSDGLVPEYMIAGKTYTLPTVTAHNYANGTDPVVSVSVTVNGNKRNISGDSWAVEGNDGEAVTFEWTAAGQILSATAKIVDVADPAEQGLILVEKYFVSSGANINKDANSVNITATTDTAVDFINKLSATSLKIETKVENAEGFSVSFKDAFRYGYDITVNFVIVGDGTEVYIGDEFVGKVSSKFSESTTIGFSSDDKSLVVADKNFAINRYSNYLPFEGFYEHFCNVSFTLKHGTVLKVSQINTQKLNSSVVIDMVRPDVHINGTYGGSMPKGYVYKIASASVGDVLEPNLKFSLTVTKPDGGYAIDENGVVLNGVSLFRDYYLPFADYGTYTIIYLADGPGVWDTEFRYNIISLDIEPPVLIVDLSKISGREKVGYTVNLPSASVSDNVSARDKISVRIYVEDSLGKISLVSGSYRFGSKGEYEIYYVAYDESNNSALVSKKIVIS